MNKVLLDKKEVIPSKIVCIGRNYVEHIEELNNEIPDQPVIFLKPNSSITHTLQPTHGGEPLHYESELCFIVENNRLSAVGFGLDLTKRGLQSKLKAKGLPWERAKAFDGSAVFSHFVPLTEESPFLTIRLEINGQTVQEGNTGQMINKPDNIFKEISTFMTLSDGDIVMTGTPKGVGTIQAGDHFHGEVLLNGNLIIKADWTAEGTSLK